LREILVALGANDGNMEEGSLRCDANVSIRPVGQTTLGTKAEVKNVNSFKFLQKALEFEIDRQIEVVRSGGRVRQETRLWDSAMGETISMRSKEEAHDYRYFPEPDLQPLDVDAAWVASIRASLPELPEARKQRLMAAHGLGEYDADLLVRLIAGGADYFETMVAAGASAKAASNWMQGEVRRKLKDLGADDMARFRIGPAELAELVAITERGVISSTVAKDVFEEMWTSGGRAQAIVDARGLAQIDDRAALAALIAAVVEANPDAVAQVRAGRNNTFGFLVGQVMKASQGKANPKVVSDMLKAAIG
jgi:aspartyl-tRNA(Asn)/glutamyl-tRNA(Gln) amidotransferase subunit B